MSLLAAAAVAGPVLGGIIGNVAAKKDREAAQAALARGFQELDALGLPPDLSKRIVYEKFMQQGLLTPELEEDIELGASQVSLIQEDQGLKDIEMQALNEIMQRGKVGLSAEDRLALNQIRQETQRDAEAKRQQIISDFAARGQGGSGAELIAALSAGQAATEQASMESDRVAAMAAQNALNAISQGGQLAGSIQQGQFGRDLARAEGADQFSMADFNAANARQRANIDRQNVAQQYNLGEQQRIADANIQMENAERLRMEQAKRDFYNDRLQKASAYTGAGANVAQGYQSEAQRKAGMWSGIGSALGQGAMGYANMQNTNQQNELNRQAMTKTGAYKV